MPKKRWRRRGRRAASSHSSSPAKRTPTRPLDYRHDEPDDRLTVRARATGRGARSSRRTPQSVVPEKEKNRIIHNKGAVLGLDGGRSRGGQSVATYVKRGATYAKGGGSTSRGRTRRGSVGSAGGALPNRTHLQCFGRYPVTSSSRSRPVLPRGKPQAESAGGSPPRPRGLGPGRRGSQSGPLGGEAAPAWKKGNYFSRSVPNQKKAIMLEVS